MNSNSQVKRQKSAMFKEKSLNKQIVRMKISQS